MWPWRGSRTGSPSVVPRLGVGVQVWVTSAAASPAEAWEGEPTGVIVARGSSVANASLGVHRLAGPTWVVAFDGFEYRADGSGPHERAEIVESMLVAAPYADLGVVVEE